MNLHIKTVYYENLDNNTFPLMTVILHPPLTVLVGQTDSVICFRRTWAKGILWVLGFMSNPETADEAIQAPRTYHQQPVTLGLKLDEVLETLLVLTDRV